MNSFNDFDRDFPVAVLMQSAQRLVGILDESLKQKVEFSGVEL
jgi:hypothetical protein